MYQHDLHKYLDFRPLLEQDVSDVLRIEESCYEFPWSEQIFNECIRSDYSCYAISLYQKFSGYLIVSTVLDEAHLLNVCLSKDWQGQGLGEVVLFWLFDELKKHNIERVFLEVRPSNLVALALYNKIGFETISVRQDYYPAQDGREDALAMVRTL